MCAGAGVRRSGDGVGGKLVSGGRRRVCGPRGEQEIEIATVKKERNVREIARVLVDWRGLEHRRMARPLIRQEEEVEEGRGGEEEKV